MPGEQRLPVEAFRSSCVLLMAQPHGRLFFGWNGRGRFWRYPKFSPGVKLDVFRTYEKNGGVLVNKLGEGGG